MSKVVRKTQAVTARQLSRNISKVLDEIDADGSARIIVRYGRPSALLVPFEESAEVMKLPRLADIAIGGFDGIEEFDEASLDAIELDDSMRQILLDIFTCTVLYWKPSRMNWESTRVSVALGELAVSGLVEQGQWGWSLTRKGEALAARLDSNA